MAKAKTVIPDDDDDSYLDEPKPRTSILNLILCVLNLLAVGGFAFILMLDLDKRQSWSYAVFLHDLAIMGLPLKEEDDLSSTAREAAASKASPRSEQLLEAFKKRHPGANGVFMAREQPLAVHILPRHLTEEVLKDYFGSVTPQIKNVQTLEDEVDRVKQTLFTDIDKVAADTAAAAKTPEDKKQKLEKLLLPLAGNVFHARELDRRMREAGDDARKLDDLLKAAVQTRILLDIVLPVEIVWPGDADKYSANQDVDSFKKLGDDEKDEKIRKEKTDALIARLKNPVDRQLKTLKDKLSARLENAVSGQFKGDLYQGKDWEGKKMSPDDKRLNIALLLFAIAHAQKPDGTPLNDHGPERAEIVAGVVEYALAADAYAQAERKLEERVIQLVKEDREGTAFEQADGTINRVPGFTERYGEAVKLIRGAYNLAEREGKRLQLMQAQAAQEQKLYYERLVHLDDIKARLLAKREVTAKKLAELRVMQDQLFHAQLELADAAERNRRLELQLRKEEGLKVPGGPLP